MDFKIHQNKENGNVFYNINVVELLFLKFTNILSCNVLKGVQYIFLEKKNIFKNPQLDIFTCKINTINLVLFKTNDFVKIGQP
jgi:hypothetical protein